MEKIADKKVDIAKKIITEEVEKVGYQVDRIILFGSRARGDYKEDSDYDLFIILKQNIPHDVENKLFVALNRRMNKLNIDNDIIITSSGELKKNNNVGNITYYALKYGEAV